MGGNTGIQSLTVITRGIALGEIEFSSGLRAIGKEVAVALANGAVIQPEHIHLDTRRNECDHRMHVLRNAGGRVQRDCRPDDVDFILGNAAAA